jgi:hypothetical protein
MVLRCPQVYIVDAGCISPRSPQLTMKFSLLAALALAGAALASPVDKGYPNRIVFIRHAEKGCATLPGDDTCGDMPRRPGGEWPGHPPPGGPGGPGGKEPRKFPNGLSNKGKERAEYLRTVSASGGGRHPFRA